MRKTFLIIFLLLTSCLIIGCKKKIPTYTVTFMDGETILKTEIVEEGNNAIGLTPTKEGYNFTGWDVSIENITSDIVAVAQFNIKTYTVTFKDGETVLKTETVEHGKTATGLTPSKEGYTFTGWDVSIENVKSDITATALFDLNKYTVTFMDDDEVFKTELVNHGENLSLLSFIKEGYVFDGLFLDSSYSLEYNMNTLITNDTIIYAKFIKSYNLTLVIEGEEAQISVLENTKIEDLVAKEIEEKKFVGWYYDPDYKKFAAIKTVIEEDMTLYAKFIDAVYTVTFETNGGYKLKKQNFTTGTIPDEPMYSPSKLGYEFSYWSLDALGNEVYCFDQIIKEDFTLYANYIETDYYGLLDSIVPDVIEENIDFPTRRDYFEYNWEISDPTLLSYGGIYNPEKTDKVISVTLKMNVMGSEETIEFEKNVTIKKYMLKKLVRGDVVIGYTSSWYYSGYSEEVLKTVDVLNISFAFVNADGTLDLSDISKLLVETVGAGHRNGIRVCLSIQGYGEDTKNFSDCAADETLRVKLAKSMVEAVVKYRLDGIDIDWEYPGSYSGRQLSEDKANYTLLIKEIRKQLDAVDIKYLLTAAIPAGPWGHKNFELEKLVNYFDFINMMSYDLESPTIGTHHSALYHSSATATGCSVDETVEAWSERGVPLNMICLGIAFYGKDIKTRTTKNDGLAQGAITGGSYVNSAFTKACTKYIDLIGSTVNYNFDSKACAPYMFNTEKRMFYTYENELSIIFKCEYAKSEGLGGVMIWEIGEDTTNTLITAVAQGMNRKLEDKPYIVGGNQSFNIGDKITIKAIKEAADTLLSENLIYTLSDETVATIKGTEIEFFAAGAVTITASNKETGFVYGTLTITVI